MKTKIFIIVFACLFLNVTPVFSADDICRVGAGLTVPKPGMVEVGLLPGLHFYSQQGLDLKVTGPTGMEVPFELYWRVKGSVSAQIIKVESAQLLKDGVYRWQGNLEKQVRVTMIKAYLTSDDYVAKVDVYGNLNGAWKLLAKDAALYRVDGSSRAEIAVTPGNYTGFRLDFISFDEKYKQKPAPVDSVEAISETKGTDFIEQAILADFKTVVEDNTTDITAALPGSGIMIKSINVQSEQPFMGEWIVEQEIISSGKRSYEIVESGKVDELKAASTILRMEIGAALKGRNIKVKLKSDKPLGKIRKMETIALLPKLVFKAETAGVYNIQAGCGETALILEEPSAQNRGVLTAAGWGAVKQNPQWKPENLVEKYKISGGPFKARWYTWEAPLKIEAPGYYRVVLNQAAALDGYYGSLRVVREEKQVPYFISEGEKTEVPLVLSETYDSKTNKSIWILELPEVSEVWQELTLQAEGIFSRKLIIETQNSGALSWEPWKDLNWSSTQNKKSDLKIPFYGSPEGTVKLRLTIEHGDNSKITVLKATASYIAPAICFLAQASEGYVLYGGHQEAKSPQYDLNLIQDALLTQEPEKAEMGELKVLATAGLNVKFLKFFESTSWGLYAVLGIVTIFLLIIIAKLFPAVDGKKKDK